MINFYNEDIEFPDIDTSKYISWIQNIVCYYNFQIGDINFIFCSDEYLLNINIKFLNHNYYTDIITFNYNEDNNINSDIYISLETVKSNSLEYNSTFQSELSRVIIHGVLHLIGFDDKDEHQQEIMTQKEDEALRMLTL
ncbi:MAG: rRNA maturation RNase YbeY [Prolixibacteraceae bacterium]|nr:rRNA maturation RNase YbeY [Prolixibacteraceae bacterium]